MSNDFRTQMYNTLNLKETDELVEIWQMNDRVEWSELAFQVIREILQERLGEIPSQNEAVYKHIKQETDAEAEEIPPEYELADTSEDSSSRIEFEGFYGKETLRRNAALGGMPSKKQVFWRIIIFVFLVGILILILLYVVQSKEYFSRISYLAFLVLVLIYSLFLHPILVPHLKTKSSGSNLKLYKGFVSAQGIKFTSAEKLKTVAWSKIYRAKKADDLIILFAEYISPMAFPRGFFKSEADWEQFRNWVDFYLQKTKTKAA